jgi:hypothetical protein
LGNSNFGVIVYILSTHKSSTKGIDVDDATLNGKNILPCSNLEFYVTPQNMYVVLRDLRANNIPPKSTHMRLG